MHSRLPVAFDMIDLQYLNEMTSWISGELASAKFRGLKHERFSSRPTELPGNTSKGFIHQPLVSVKHTLLAMAAVMSAGGESGANGLGSSQNGVPGKRKRWVCYRAPGRD